MTNVEEIKFEQNQPLLSYIEKLFEDKFSFSSSDRVLKVIEIGCGAGDLTLIFKDKFKDKVQITAIDPSEVDIAAAKKKTVDACVDFQHSDIFNFSTTTRYDLVLFTKSLHHCIPVERAVQNGYNLLSDDGIFFAEEIYLERMQSKDTRWFFDRLDLLLQTDCMSTLEEAATKCMPSFEPIIARLLDTNLPIQERWFRPHQHEYKHGEPHTHQDDHKHEDGHTHQHHPHHDHGDIAGSSAVIDAIAAQFGKQNITKTPVPYFYQILVFSGLKSTPVLQEFYKQESRAIEIGYLGPLGIHIVSHK